MTKDKYIKTLTENLDGTQTVEEVGQVIAEMYHATPEQVWALTEIETAMWGYMDTKDIDQLAEDLMHETSEQFIPCGSCGEVYPVEAMIDAGTGDWADDLCPVCADRIGDHAYVRSETKASILQGDMSKGRLHAATADYLDLDRSTWVATTIDSDGYREDYITDKVLYELVEQLAEDLAAAKTDKDRDRLLDRHLDVLDAWQEQPTIKISLAAARVNAGLTQEEAGALIGVSELTIRNWELGKYRPTPERYPAIEGAYGIPIVNIII